MVQCSTCGKEYSTKRSLIRYHYYDNPDHAPESWEECPKCKKVFEKDEDLKIHHKREHGESIAHTETCKVCGSKFRCKPSHNRRTCSKECQYKSMRSRKTILCEQCDKEFEILTHEEREFCSKECAAKSREKKETKNCTNCDKEVTRKKSHIERVENVYCSEECYKDSLPDAEWKNSFNRKEFRNKVLKRDNYACQDCGKEKDLQAHHIKRRYKEKNESGNEENGVTLCRECHAQRHRESGEDRIANLIENHPKEI